MTTDIVSPPIFAARMIRELKGAPLSCLMLLFLSDGPVSNEWICRMSGYTDKPVAQALKLLSDPEYQIARRSRGGWVLSSGFQLILGNDESRKNSVPTTTTLINKDINQDLKAVVVSRKNSDSEEDERYLANFQACVQNGIHEPSASVISNFEHVSPEFIKAHVDAIRGKKGETIGLAITRIKNNEQPVAKETDQSQRTKYVTGTYADFIEH